MLNRKEPKPYVSKPELAARVREFQTAGRMSDQLVTDLQNIAGGVWDRYRYTDSREDFVQDVFAHFMKTPLNKVDCERNVFGYLTTCAMTYGHKQRCRSAEKNRKHAEYVADVGYLLGRAVEVDPDDEAPPAAEEAVTTDTEDAGEHDA